MEEAVSKKRKAFVTAYRSDENRQAYISASRHASIVIAKAKTGAWQATCSSHLTLKSVYSFFRSVPGSSSSSLNFPDCSSPKESTSIFGDYLRSHFFVTQPKALGSRARGYLYEFCPASCFEESHSSFCSPFLPG